MRRAPIIIIVCCLIVFGSGVGLGVGVKATWPPLRYSGGDGGGPDHGSFLARELNLTPAQQEQMKEIWSEVVKHQLHEGQGPGASPGATPGAGVTPGAGADHRHALEQEREQRMLDLLTTPEQLFAYAELTMDCNRRLEDAARERQAIFDQAVEKTRQILDPAQREKYDQLLKSRDMGGHRGHGPWGHAGPPPSLPSPPGP